MLCNCRLTNLTVRFLSRNRKNCYDGAIKNGAHGAPEIQEDNKNDFSG